MSEQDETDAPLARVRIWDPFVRVFHWLLAASVIGGWLLGEFGPAVMTWHFYLGYLAGGLVVARVIWGFVGPRPARFSDFIKGPAATARYAAHLLERRPSHWPGHNPMGGWSVLALLGLIAVQVATGLIADPEDYINVGPLASYVDASTNRLALSVHHLVSKLILLMVLLHIGIILFYRVWKRENLVRPMLTGWKLVRRRD